jgi:hypothetical protein
VVKRVTKKLPLLDFISITKASENDLNTVRPILNQLVDKSIFADKAYFNIPLNIQLMKEQNTYIYTPVKLVKGESEQTRQFKKLLMIYFLQLFLRSDSLLKLFLIG